MPIDQLVFCHLFCPMRLVDRLQQYLDHYRISAYAFEHACELSNGYLGKQLKGKGAVGSEILQKIKSRYTDLSLVWLITGRGAMLLPPPKEGTEKQPTEWNEEQQTYFSSKDEVIKLLYRQIEKLEGTIADKEKINHLLELQIRQVNAGIYKRVQ
jgi:hypothetical protein